MKRFRQGLRRFLIALCATGAGALCVACQPGAVVRGVVLDTKGETLPGVAVTVEGGESNALTNALGQYSLWCSKGEALTLHFMKTGYTPGMLSLAVPPGAGATTPVRLWPLPDGEGVYFLSQMRYQALDHPKPVRYIVEDSGPALGTQLEPKAVAPGPFGGPEALAGEPVLMAHKLPAYDARLSRLRPVNAALPQNGLASAPPQDPSNGQTPRAYPEKAWIAADTVPLVCRPVDEPGRLLVELAPPSRLAPGVYAVHWGALEGLLGLESRIFLFRVPDPSKPAETADAPGAATPQGEDKPHEDDRERQRKERRKEMEKETGEGMG